MTVTTETDVGRARGTDYFLLAGWGMWGWWWMGSRGTAVRR